MHKQHVIVCAAAAIPSLLPLPPAPPSRPFFLLPLSPTPPSCPFLLPLPLCPPTLLTHNACEGGYIIQPHKLRDFVVPDLTGFKVSRVHGNDYEYVHSS